MVRTCSQSHSARGVPDLSPAGVIIAMQIGAV